MLEQLGQRSLTLRLQWMERIMQKAKRLTPLVLADILAACGAPADESEIGTNVPGNKTPTPFSLDEVPETWAIEVDEDEAVDLPLTCR